MRGGGLVEDWRWNISRDTDVAGCISRERGEGSLFRGNGVMRIHMER